MKAISPHGDRWRVTRRTYPWRPRAMGFMRGPELPERRSEDLDRPYVYGGVVMPRGNAAFELTGLPLAALERLLLLVLLPPTLLARSLGLVAWTVVARQGRGSPWERSVRGNARAKELMARVVEAIEYGRPFPGAAEEDPAP